MRKKVHKGCLKKLSWEGKNFSEYLLCSGTKILVLIAETIKEENFIYLIIFFYLLLVILGGVSYLCLFAEFQHVGVKSQVILLE